MTTLLLASGPSATTGQQLLYAILPLLLLALAVDIYCLVDLVRAPSVRYLPKVMWALIICVSFPAGALLYMFLGRNRNQGSKLAR